MKRLITLFTGLLFIALPVVLSGCDDSDDHQHHVDRRGGRFEAEYESKDSQSQATQYAQTDTAEAGSDNNCN